MAKEKSEPQVSKLHIDRRIRRVLLWEIVFVCLLYGLLFFISNRYLGQQNRFTDAILSRFQITVEIQGLERLLATNTALARSYRLQSDEKKFEQIVKNYSDFGDQLDKTRGRLDKVSINEASKLVEEKKQADLLQKNYLAMISHSNSLLGKNVLTAVAQFKVSNAQARDFPVVPSSKTPEELEKALSDLESESLGVAANWRTLAERDIERLKDQLVFAQRYRTAIVVIQAILVVIGLTVVSYTYVLPSFERILKQVVRQNEELLRADAMKTEFLSIASHQLRTPLSVIKWTTAMLLKSDQKLNDSQRDLLHQAKSSAETVIQLVGNLLNLSRLEQGRLEHHPVPTDIVPIIQQIVKDSQPMAESKKLTLTEEHAADTIELEVDPLLFKEVVQNLVDNAIAYNRENGIVKISTRKREGRWIIDVADTGYGIMPEDMKNLFTKFYRGTNARTIRPNGSGLGLYFIKKIMTLHGGKIDVESEPNQGTIFSLMFPVHARQTVTAKGRHRAAAELGIATQGALNPSPRLSVTPTPLEAVKDPTPHTGEKSSHAKPSKQAPLRTTPPPVNRLAQPL